MAKYEWSEVFMSIEGEGPYAGTPTSYIRFTKCNFQCQGFNNPSKLDTTDIQVIGFDPKAYTRLQDIPPITRGCDSIYSWDPKFSHMWHTGDETELLTSLIDTLPNKSFILPSGQRVILSITGGEPTLRAKFFPALLQSPLLQDCRHILLETNCAVPIQASFIQTIADWIERYNGRWTFSNSPKLSASGEAWKDAIRPEIALKQFELVQSHPNNADMYFKFVCDDTDESFAEVKRAMAEYEAHGIVGVKVYIMPMACQEEDQQKIAMGVANRCVQEGYIYCHRVHLSTFGNTVGT